MAYVEGFLIAVSETGKDAYLAMARAALPLFREFGATRMVECWGDDVSHGKLTDFHRAVKTEAGETVVFSWIEYPSRAVRDAANAKMRSDPRMAELGPMAFDGARMVMGGFEVILDG